ncbi:MAG TPA: hypothetical protein VN934_05720 [Candidatus Tumulicola sp.]|nr:hypothetical protein [Candidatus Tumulicola sp.]
MGALQMACIQHAGNRSRRRGKSSHAINAFAGMAGQLAVQLWMHHVGFSARMSLIRPRPDAGFDITVLGKRETRLEVKTGCPKDGRNASTLRHGDALRIPTYDFQVGAALWCILDPGFQDTLSTTIHVDIVAAVPILLLNPESPDQWIRWWERFNVYAQEISRRQENEVKILFRDIRHFDLNPQVLIDVLRPISMPWNDSTAAVSNESSASLPSQILDVVRTHDLFSDSYLEQFRRDTLEHAGVLRFTELLLEREPIFGGSKWARGQPILPPDSPPGSRFNGPIKQAPLGALASMNDGSDAP